MFRHASNRYKKYLCPIVWYKPGMIVAKQASPLNEEKEFFTSFKKFCEKDTFYYDVLSLARKYYLSKTDIRATSSWGTLNGEKVLIDYGCPSRSGYWFYKIKFFT